MGRESGITGLRMGRVKSRNMYKGPMDKEKRCRELNRRWERVEQGIVMGGKMWTTVIEQQ